MSLRSSVAPLFDGLGLLDLTATVTRPFAPRDVTILMYHRVAVPGSQTFQSDRLISATPDEFEEQMRWVARYAAPISFSELHARLSARKPLPRRAVVVTFDDGYLDNYLHAYPVLRRYRIGATIFLVTGAVGEVGSFWWDAASVSLARLRLAPAEMAAELERMKHLEDGDRKRRLDELTRKAGIGTGDFPRSVVNWEEVLEMSADGIEFGGHTVTHPILSKIRADELQAEISGCKKAIEEKTNKPVLVFAYPVGRTFALNDLVVHAVGQAGYAYAVTTSYGRCRPDLENPLKLPRIGVGLEDSLPRFKAKLLAPRYFSPLGQSREDFMA